jgi:2OG-Fe(II) oxygenase superfamily
MPISFSWTAFDVTGQLPDNWQEDIGAIATKADFRDFPRTPVLSREAENVAHVARGRVYAHQVQERLPWLYKLYRSDFLELARKTCGESVEAAFDDRYGVVMNVQRGSAMRFECHVDSNPLTGLLFCTDHPAGGGELVFGNDSGAADMAAVERDRSVIRPHAGHLIFFDGRRHPHYARPLTSESDVRVVAVMNFYTQSCPESTRPPGLNRHLFGKD